MSENAIRIGILGMGGVVAKRHVPALKALPGLFRIAGVARGDARKLDAAKQIAGCDRGYADWRDLIGDPAIDAVLIASPNARHAEQAVAAMAAGKDVLCEKPPGVTHAEALQVAEAARQHARICQYGFPLRFADGTRLARRALVEGLLGAVYHVRVHWFRRRGFPTKGSWFTTRSLSGGGVLADLGSHLLDRALHLLGFPKVEAVSALTHERMRDSQVEHPMQTGRKSGDTGVCDVEDLAVCLFRLEGGVSLVLEASFAANLPETPHGTDLLGDRAGLRLQGGGAATLYGEALGAVTDTALDPQGASASGASPFALQLEDFARCVRTREAPSADPEQGAALMQALEAAYRSAAAGREVRVGETRD